MKLFLALFVFTIIGQASGSDKTQYLLTQIAEDESYYKTSLDSDQKTQFITAVEQIAVGAFKERNDADKEFPGWKPADLYNVYFSNVNSMFLAGYTTEANVSQWKIEYTQLINTVLNLTANRNYYSNINNQHNFYKQKYKEVHQNFVNRMSSMNPGCASEGDLTKNKKCCSNHVKLIQEEEFIPGQASCVKEKQECTTNGQCCSGMCNKETVDGPGVCLPQTYCSEIRDSGNLCDDQNSICSTGQCINLDISEVTVDNSCLNSANVCQSNSQCCSDSCVNNRCVEISKCMSCKKDGSILESGESCCPGYINLGGKCMSPMPVWAPTVNLEKKKSKNYLEIVLSILIPSAHATETTHEITAAQKELLVEKRSACDTANAPGSAEHKICMDGVAAVESTYKEDRFTGLTQVQTDEVAAAREECTSSYATGDDDHKACMKDADDLEKGHLSTNVAAGEACLVHTKGSEKYKVCMSENGVMGISLGKQDYVDKYNIPGVTAKTYSNIKQCSFNSLNDSWRDASNKERNAEVFLRAFEYVYANKGSQDYWVEQGKGNVFSRANKIAIEFRKNRGRMMAEMLEIDKKMACKCIAIFGPAKFSTLKQNFFNSSCEEEKAQLQAELGEDLNKGQTVGNVDGTSVATVGSEVSELDKQNAAVEEIDKGAIGLSHERLLVEWLQLRAESQMTRFDNNADLEEELTELSEFITNVDFNEVFKDRIQGTDLIESSPKGDSQLLFKWGYTYRPGWFKIFSMLTFGIVEGFILNKFFNFDKGSAGSGKAAVNHGMKAAWRYHESDEIDAAPEIVDVKTKKKKCVKRKLGVCLKYMDGFHRYFIGPRFDNAATDVANRCLVKGRASACFKSGYRTDLNGEINYVMDVTRPLFVTAGDVAINVMPGYAKTFPQMVNTARDAGVNFLKGKEPGGTIKWGYKNGGSSFGNQDHIGEAIAAGHFLPVSGNLIIKNVELENGPDVKGAIKRGATKYAMCKSLKLDCGASEFQDPEVYGFGYLFEAQSEAQLFSDYVYEIHWKWSHLTKNNFMGYPLAGMDTYFKLTAQNMKLVGSFAASRSLQYADAYQKYNTDFNERLGEYNSLGEASAGTRSRNLKYGEQFYKLFGKLDFSGESNIEAFNASMNSASASGEFNTAEISALNSGRASAVRRNNDLKRKKEFEKALANAGPAAKNAFSKNSAFLNKVNSPLSSFGMAKFGGGSKALKGLTNAINKMNGNIKDLNKGSSGGSASRYKSNFTMPKMPSYNRSAGTSSVRTGDDSDTGLSDSGMSKNQVNSLLKNLKKKKGELEPTEDDTLFSIVSKAYKRNYSRVLKRVGGTKVVQGRNGSAKINDKDKSELKNILESN
jgi:hypothetical protein